MSFHCSDPLSGSPAALKATLMLTGELSAVWPSLPELSQLSLPLLYLSSTHPLLCVSPLHVLHLCLEHLSCPSAPSAGSLLPSRQLSFPPLHPLPWPGPSTRGQVLPSGWPCAALSQSGFSVCRSRSFNPRAPLGCTP